MPKYELAVCVEDEPDDVGGVRIKKGDLITIREYPCNWGLKQIDSCLIVIIETIREYDFLRKLIPQMVYKEVATNSLIIQPEYETLVYGGGRNKNEFELAYKRRFQLAHAKIKAKLSDLNLTKVRNKSIKYQPFKNATQLVQKFDGLNNHRYLEVSKVDCYSSHADNNTEFSINLDNIPAVIIDKFTGQLVKP